MSTTLQRVYSLHVELLAWLVRVANRCALEHTNQKNLDQAQCSFTEYSPRAIDICCLNEHTLTSREIACLCGWLREAGAQNFFHRLPNYSVWLRFDGCAYDELIQYNYDKRPERL